MLFQHEIGSIFGKAVSFLAHFTFGLANKDGKAAEHDCDDEALDVEPEDPFRRVMKQIVALDVG